VNVFYEEDGGYKVGTVLEDNSSSLQVETLHGKRVKVKAAAVLLRFASPGPGAFIEAAQRLADGIDLDFLWEVAPQDEFDHERLARDYFGAAPTPPESGGLLLKLHSAPMYFHRKGKGRYRPAPPDTLKAALAGAEKRRLQAEQQATWTAALVGGALPDAWAARIDELLYAPEKGSLEAKAIDGASAQTGLSPMRLFERAGAVPSSHDYHLRRFLFTHFRDGTGFGDLPPVPVPDDLPLSDTAAFSIDDAATTEIDDAFSVAPLATGGWRIGVHIAAPALGIAPGDAFDRIAARRLSTVYMPGRKITMLPEAVIDAYTLAAGAARPAVSLYVTTDAGLDPVGWETRVERVPIAANLRHDALEPLFNDATVAAGHWDWPWGAELKVLRAFALKREVARGKAGEPVPERLEYSFHVDPVTQRVRIVPRLRGSPIDHVVAEMMILVNSRWGGDFAAADLPALYRVQSGGKVRMTTVPGPHDGLGVAQYAWSSSPLRRYVDLVNQRQIVALATGTPAPYAPRAEALSVALRDFEVAYEAWNEVQRTMERWWCLRWFEQDAIERATATVLRESMVRIDGLPLVLRVPSLPPEVEPGARVEVAVTDIDLLDLDARCRYLGRVPLAPVTAAAAVAA
jgi:exoribonuclease-2